MPGRRALTAALLVTAIGALAGCGSSSSVDTDASGSDTEVDRSTPFTINYATPPATLDPAEASSLFDAGFISNFYVTLTKHGTKQGENGFPEDDLTKVEPYLATEWTESDGGKTWTFKLRDDAKFPDGTPMDSEAVKYSFERAATRNTTGSVFLNATMGPGFVTAIEAPDPTTVILRLKAPSPYVSYPDLMTYSDLAIVNPTAVEANGGIDADTPNEWMASHTAGGGPYLLEEYDPSTRAVLAANPDFFGEQPKEPRVVVNFVSSDSTLALQATNGSADVTVGLQYRSVAGLKDNDCCRVVANKFGSTIILTMPNLMEPFDDKLFRQGLSYAVPYDGIIETVAHGYASGYDGPFPSSYSTHNPEIGGPRATDADKAKQLIEQSGVKLPIDVDLIVRQGDNDGTQIATIVQDSWRPLGVNVDVKVLAADEYTTARRAPNRKFLMIEQRSLAFNDPSWTLAGELGCLEDGTGNIANVSDWCNEEVIDLFKRVTATPREERQPLWDELAKLWIEETPRVQVYSPQYVVVLGKQVKDYHFGTLPLAIWRWGR